MPIVVAFENASGPAADELMRIYSPDNREELSPYHIEIIRTVLDEVKAAEECQRLTEQSSEHALSAIAGVNFSSWALSESWQESGRNLTQSENSHRILRGDN